MKTPVNIGSNNLSSFLQNKNEFCMAHLFLITLPAGTVLRYTDWEVAITISTGVATGTYLPGSPYIKKGKITEEIGTSSSSMDLTIISNPSDMAGNFGVLKGIGLGLWDGATVIVYKLFMSTRFQQIGYITRFAGWIGNVDKIGRTGAQITVQSFLEQLQAKLPRNIIQPGCIHTLFDAGCLANPVTFSFNGTVATNTTVNTLYGSSLAQATGYYDLGKINFTSGILNGMWVTVKNWFSGSPGHFTFNRPLVALPAVGDTFTAYAGCDKQQTTCNTKFSNTIHFTGFRWVPAPEVGI